MYETIKSLQPYFHSLREVQNKVSLDIKIPTNWEFEKTLSMYKMIQYKIQDKNEKNILLSIFSTPNSNGYMVVFGCANDIIKINKEQEQKQQLFKEKVSELEKLFNVNPLDKLKELKFTNGEQEDSTQIRITEPGDLESGDNKEGYPASEDKEEAD